MNFSFSFNSGNVAWLLIVWAFYIGMGLPAFTWATPFVLLVIGSVLYLAGVSFSAGSAPKAP